VTDSDWNFYETIVDEEKKENVTDLEGEISMIECKTNTNCDTIHLGIICGGYNSTREFYVLLKSILFYRTNPIHLHLMVDDISSEILAELFKTWPVPSLDIDYYNASKHEPEISWIPTHHYSKQYGLLKLIFPSLISKKHEDISKLIILDTDTLMLGNVNYIYKLFAIMSTRGNIPIGLVENQSDWYLGTHRDGQTSPFVGDRLIWPAIGRGFNTGLILFDLVQLKLRNWDQIWREVAELELITRLSTTLADQDIFNAVIRTYPNLVMRLPSYCNIQLNDHADFNKVFRETEGSPFKLIHWNSPVKYSSRNSMVQDEYLKWYLTFLNWDASLLSRVVCNTKDLKRGEQTARDELDLPSATMEQNCQTIRPRPWDKLRTYLNFFEQDKTLLDADRDISIVIHLSLDRLRTLDELAAHWAGPISVAIYLPESELSLLIDSISDSENLHERKNIAYHLVFRQFGFNYPINRLRNIALNGAKTSFVFLCDADFLPSYNSYEYLKSTLAQELEMMVSEGRNSSDELLFRKAWVVPAFESSQYKFEFPTSKAELERQLNLGSVMMFRAQIWPRGHAPTNYAKWRVSTKPYAVQWQPDYEPFIVTNRQHIARFDERFVGFGWNKVEHIMKLAAMGYEFLVLPEAFVVHQFHPASYDIIRHRESQRYRACIRHLKLLITSELVIKYPDFLPKLRSNQ